ncbi:MAG: DUF1800 domain-containing protein [Chloroflexi bacterium]|nr:DUF1800 domain-containing protein [Chloroflexota bacterium]
MTTTDAGASTDIRLLSHLYRRAGFGATREQLEQLSRQSYEDTVEFLLNPSLEVDLQPDVLSRYFGGESPDSYVSIWIYRMLNSRCQLQEKMALFWHHVFATGLVKNEHILSSTNQIDMFRRNGMTNLRDILLDLSRDPAMLYWLDNNENHNGEPNENYGRELLELFSMGVGNYSEMDIKDASRAFTGWTFGQPPPLYPHGYYPASFVFDSNDHDGGEKTFLGHTGNLDGGDILDIIVKQPASARFISRHMYNFFVADEPQVPTWNDLEPLDPQLIDEMSSVLLDSGGEIKSALRVMFNSASFKAARFKKVKSPIEFVVGVLKMAGEYTEPRPGLMKYSTATVVMGQKLLDPPTVEGWHTGKEWIDGGNLTERVNFAVEEIGNGTSPGILQMVTRMIERGGMSSPEDVVNSGLDLMGQLEVDDSTRDALVKFAGDSKGDADHSRAVRMLRLIAAAPEFQFA